MGKRAAYIYLETEAEKWNVKSKEVNDRWVAETTWRTDTPFSDEVKDEFIAKTAAIKQYREEVDASYRHEFGKDVLGEFASVKK